MQKIVLDTNGLLSSISTKSKSYIVWQKLHEGAYVLCVTNEILNEYQEIIAAHTTPEIAANIINAILSLENVARIESYYKFNLIEQDADDNKFVDCAVAAGATYIVTNDAHFNVLDSIPFPHVEHILLEEFVEILKNT